MSHKSVIVLCVAVFALSACGAGKRMVQDDAYYYPGSEPAVVETATLEPTYSGGQQTKPEITYTNVQDTTVTIVIKNK